MRPPQLQTWGTGRSRMGQWLCGKIGPLNRAGEAMGGTPNPEHPSSPAFQLHAPRPPLHPHAWASPQPTLPQGSAPPLQHTDERLRPREGPTGPGLHTSVTAELSRISVLGTHSAQPQLQALSPEPQLLWKPQEEWHWLGPARSSPSAGRPQTPFQGQSLFP